MKYKLRDDVVLEKVSGINMLISLRSAWGESPFALQIASVSAFIWRSLRDGLEDNEIIKSLVITRHYSEEKAERIFDNFIRSAEKFHYLLPEERYND